MPAYLVREILKKKAKWNMVLRKCYIAVGHHSIECYWHDDESW